MNCWQFCRWVPVFCALASGCAGLSQSECLAGDWYGVGFADGARGVQRSQLLKHQKACGRHGVVPDSVVYEEGWAEGVLQFCTPENGFEQGREGSAWRNVCPEAVVQPFRLAWEDGRALHEAQQRVATVRNEIESAEEELEELVDAVAADEHALVHDELSAEERGDLLKKTKRAASRRGRLEERLRYLDGELARAQDRFEELQDLLGSR